MENKLKETIDMLLRMADPDPWEDDLTDEAKRALWHAVELLEKKAKRNAGDPMMVISEHSIVPFTTSGIKFYHNNRQYQKGDYRIDAYNGYICYCLGSYETEAEMNKAVEDLVAAYIRGDAVYYMKKEKRK